jgi:hypothetical protein
VAKSLSSVNRNGNLSVRFPTTAAAAGAVLVAPTEGLPGPRHARRATVLEDRRSRRRRNRYVTTETFEQAPPLALSLWAGYIAHDGILGDVNYYLGR